MVAVGAAVALAAEVVAGLVGSAEAVDSAVVAVARTGSMFSTMSNLMSNTVAGHLDSHRIGTLETDPTWQRGAR